MQLTLPSFTVLISILFLQTFFYLKSKTYLKVKKKEKKKKDYSAKNASKLFSQALHYWIIVTITIYAYKKEDSLIRRNTVGPQ